MLRLLSSISEFPKATTMTVPKKQWAAVRVGVPSDEARAPLQEIDVELPGPDEILIKINW
jgi:hypothetical protein